MQLDNSKTRRNIYKSPFLMDTQHTTPYKKRKFRSRTWAPQWYLNSSSKTRLWLLKETDSARDPGTARSLECVSAFLGSSNLNRHTGLLQRRFAKADRKHSTESKAPIRICRILGLSRLQIAIWTRRVRQSKMLEYPPWVFDLHY